MPHITTSVSDGRREPLRYYMHDGSTAFRFQLAGGLSAEGAMELEQAWRTASSVIHGRDLIVDLSYVTNIDETGHELLKKWHAHGARFVAISAEAKARVQAMTDRPVQLTAANRKESTWLPFRAAVLCLAAFHMLLFSPAASASTSKEGSRYTRASGRNGTLDNVMFPLHRSFKVQSRGIPGSQTEETLP